MPTSYMIIPIYWCNRTNFKYFKKYIYPDMHIYIFFTSSQYHKSPIFTHVISSAILSPWKSITNKINLFSSYSYVSRSEVAWPNYWPTNRLWLSLLCKHWWLICENCLILLRKVFFSCDGDFWWHLCFLRSCVKVFPFTVPLSWFEKCFEKFGADFYFWLRSFHGLFRLK